MTLIEFIQSTPKYSTIEIHRPKSIREHKSIKGGTSTVHMLTASNSVLYRMTGLPEKDMVLSIEAVSKDYFKVVLADTVKWKI